MHYRYLPYPYYRRYYSVDPYFYRRYYNPYYNIIDSQVSDIDQSVINYGDMTDVIQDADVYQSMTPEPKVIELNKKESTEDDHQNSQGPISIPAEMLIIKDSSEEDSY